MLFLNFLAEGSQYVDPIVKLFGQGASWLSTITIGSVIVRLLLAILCGGTLGAERAMKRHAAGFRTYILVAVGAAIAGFTNEFISLAYPASDVGRIGNGVVTGIGFLGAGTILVTFPSIIAVSSVSIILNLPVIFLFMSLDWSSSVSW